MRGGVKEGSKKGQGECKLLRESHHEEGSGRGRKGVKESASCFGIVRVGVREGSRMGQAECKLLRESHHIVRGGGQRGVKERSRKVQAASGIPPHSARRGQIRVKEVSGRVQAGSVGNPIPPLPGLAGWVERLNNVLGVVLRRDGYAVSWCGVVWCGVVWCGVL